MKRGALIFAFLLCGLAHAQTAPTVTTTSLVGGTIGSVYAAQLAATGSPTITWSLVSGTLPRGISLSSSGAITGTPHRIVTANITVRATNAVDHNDKALTLAIAPTGCRTGVTIYYRDYDCDGFGTGVKSSGTYTLGQAGPLFNPNTGTFTMGDKPDASPKDPSITDTASWELVYGANDAGIAAYLSETYGFTNSSRIMWVSQSGNDSTGNGSKANPWRSMVPVLTAIGDYQGGVVVVRGGVWTDLYVGPCDGPGIPCFDLTGSSGHPLYVMSYPGELVQTNRVNENNLTYNPIHGPEFVTFDGIQWRSIYYGEGDAFKIVDGNTITIRNCEFSGWHQIYFGDHSEDIVIEDNVFHDMYQHAVYFGHSAPVSSNTANDFDFAQDAIDYAAGMSAGASYRGVIRRNSAYNNGVGGYEPFHVNTNMQGVLVEDNIVAYSGGPVVQLQFGIVDGLIQNNLFIDNSGCGVVLSVYDNVGESPSTELRNKIINNTIWVGKQTDAILGKNPNCGVQIADNTTVTTGKYIKFTTIENNIIVTDNFSTIDGSIAFDFGKNSFPDTYTIKNNIIWSNSTATPNPSTDMVMHVTSDANGTFAAGKFTFAQTAAMYGSAWANNQYVDPLLTSVSQSYTLTPELFDLRLQGISPAIGTGLAAGAPLLDYWNSSRPNPPAIGALEFAAPTSAGGTIHTGRGLQTGRVSR